MRMALFKHNSTLSKGVATLWDHPLAIAGQPGLTRAVQLMLTMALLVLFALLSHDYSLLQVLHGEPHVAPAIATTRSLRVFLGTGASLPLH